MTGTIDVFVDLSASRVAGKSLEEVVAKWQRPESLGASAQRVTCVTGPGTFSSGPPDVSPGWSLVESDSSVSVLSEALSAAGRDHVPLLVMLGPVDVTADAIGVLRKTIERDPLFGFAVPRTACARGCCLARLSRHGLGDVEWLPRRMLAELSDDELIVEVAAPSILVASDVTGNFGPMDRRFEGIVAAMLHYMASARRCGFRTILCNRCVVGVPGLACDASARPAVSDPPPQDGMLLRELVPELERSWDQSRAASQEQCETLCATRYIIGRTDARPSLLLDARNVGPFYNGTTQAVLGTAQALHALEPKWDVAMLANAEGAAFHRLGETYRGWPLYTSPPDRSFTVGFRPSQPWHIQEMVDLHRVSLFNIYLMLDTIAWDVTHSAPDHLEGTWQFLAEHADALLFDSTFTQQRFRERFPTGSPIPSLVTHFSFDPRDYTLSDLSSSAVSEPFILVIGNHLEHKDVRHTVGTLASAFPFRRIRALGPAPWISSFVTAQHSGQIPELELHRLYATADYVVFPSFYEGFGFPILTALGYGKTVLVRRSALVDEIAGHCESRGRLIVYDRREDLAEIVGRLIHGEPVPEHPLGGLRGNGRIRGWRDMASDIVTFFEALLADASCRRWIGRERAVRQLISYRT